jgi:hypothetical protein
MERRVESRRNNETDAIYIIWKRIVLTRFVLLVVGAGPDLGAPTRDQYHERRPCDLSHAFTRGRFLLLATRDQAWL